MWRPAMAFLITWSSTYDTELRLTYKTMKETPHWTPPAPSHRTVRLWSATAVFATCWCLLGQTYISVTRTSRLHCTWRVRTPTLTWWICCWSIKPWSTKWITVATHRCITSWRRWPTRRTMSPRGLYRLFSITDPSGCGLELCPRSGLDERAFHSKSHYILIPSQGILMFHKNSEPVLLGIKSLSNSHILAGYTDTFGHTLF